MSVSVALLLILNEPERIERAQMSKRILFVPENLRGTVP